MKNGKNSGLILNLYSEGVGPTIFSPTKLERIATWLSDYDDVNNFGKRRFDRTKSKNIAKMG